jgi:rRNA-processing protein FCF1
VIESYIAKYRSKGILIDTNLLLLLFIGRVSPEFIQQFKRTTTYTAADYQMLLRLIDQFEKIVVTPNVLTEVSNLANGLHGDRLRDFFKVFKESLTILSEEFVPSAEAVSQPGFEIYGLADVGISLISRSNYLVFTDDLRFADFASRNGIDVINFNHLRQAEWAVAKA